MAEIDTVALGARAEAMIGELAAISAEPNLLVRLFLTPEHRRAADLVARWMHEAGLAVSEDALGTVRGRLGEGPRLLIGSHIDTVIDAGKYDGPLGVIAGILAAAHFKGHAPVPIDVLAFGDEEGSRFPAAMTSSAACAGLFDRASLAMRDREGISLEQALRSYGKDPAAISEAAYAKGGVLAYVEVHIEQGPRLETAGQPLGVVTGIVGQNRSQIGVTGEAGHAGTVPMDLRRDALAGAAEIVLAVERIAQKNEPSGMVGTVGRLDVHPGAANIIPGEVRLTVDLRAMDDKARADAYASIEREAKSIAQRRRLAVAFEILHDEPAVACDAGLQQRLADIIASFGGRAPHLPSGAGHDARKMARLCPSAMMFVRCRKGISHNPAEYCAPEDMGLAIAAFIRFTDNFARS